MDQNKNKLCVIAGLTAIVWMISGLFALGFAADASSVLMGTDSAGSYSHDAAKKSEGSKAKSYSHGKGYANKKPEGSGAKGHSYKGHGQKFGKKEGSGSSLYGKSYSGHGKSYGGHGKSYGGHGGQKYSHGKKGRGYGKSGGQHGGGHSKQSPYAHVLKFKEKLALTADQIGKIKDKEFEHKKMSIEIKAAHAIAHLELDRLVHSGEVDEAAMRKVASQMSAIKSKKIHAMVEAKIFLLKLLTPEQRQKISKVHGGH